jgi:hypothetical protein
VKINWKPILIGFISAFAREQDAAVITSVVIPAAENIVGLFQRPAEAPALTEADVRAALQQARLPWQWVAEAAKGELKG